MENYPEKPNPSNQDQPSLNPQSEAQSSLIQNNQADSIPPQTPAPNPPNIPGQPVANMAPMAGIQQQTAVLGQIDTSPPSASFTINTKLITGLIILFVLVIGVVSYGWLLPNYWASNFISSVKSPYQKQAAQMTIVYQTLGRSVFNGSGTGASDDQDMSDIKSALKSATNDTAALASADHLIVLPGTNWSHKVSKANNEHQAMQQYISDSKTLIANYSTLMTYIQQFGQIGQDKIQLVANDLVTMQNEAGNTSAVRSIAQTTTTDLQDLDNQLKTLKPSADVQQFNGDLITAISGMQSSLQSVLAAVQGNSSVDVIGAIGQYKTSFNDLVTLTNTAPTIHIQTSSTLHDEITNLQAEHPIQ